MPIINEFFDINCSIMNVAQELDPVLYQYACPENANEYVDADMAAGAMLKARRGIEARFLNLLLGTNYTDNLLVQTDCAEAGGGICVYTRNEADSYITVDAFKPKNGYYMRTSHFVGQDMEAAEKTFYNDNARIAELGIHILRFPVTRWLAEASVRLANAVGNFMQHDGPQYPREFAIDRGPVAAVPAEAPAVALAVAAVRHRSSHRRLSLVCDSDGDTARVGGRFGQTCR